MLKSISLVLAIGASAFAGWTSDTWAPKAVDFAQRVHGAVSLFDDARSTALECYRRNRTEDFNMWSDEQCGMAFARWAKSDGGRSVATTLVKNNPDMDGNPLSGLMIAMMSPALDAIAKCDDIECVRQHAQRFGSPKAG